MNLLILTSIVFQAFFWSSAKGYQDSQMTSSHLVEMTSSVSTHSDVDASSFPVVGRRCEYKMADCVVRGHVFLNHYAKRIHKDKKAVNCSRYLSFRDCFIPLLNNECRHLEPQYSTWRPIVEQMDCACNRSDVSECLVDHRCVFRELNGYWASRCNDLYRFNMRQKTRDKCHFLEENVRCLEALVSSACGDIAARFASSYLEITSNRESKCRRNDNYNYTVSLFRYTENCPTSFLDRVDRCTTKCLTSDAVAKFHRENDVIVTGKRNALKAACRSLQKYRKCLKPLAEACPEGFDKVIEYGTDLRKYWIKMNFICRSDVFEVYHSHLQCYQKVMRREFLKQCDVIWDDLTPLVVNMTSYQFYCEPNLTDARNLVHQLDRLVSCHGAVFDSQCGRNASAVMVQLLQTVFADPAYLRLDYKPDCQLHATTTTTTTTAFPTTITTTAAAASTFTAANDSTHLPTLSLGATMWQFLRGSDPKADHRRTEEDAEDSGAALSVTRPRLSSAGVCVYLALVGWQFLATWFRLRFG